MRVSEVVEREGVEVAWSDGVNVPWFDEIDVPWFDGFVVTWFEKSERTRFEEFPSNAVPEEPIYNRLQHKSILFPNSECVKTHHATASQTI